jgi:hypothetical protein
MRLEASRAWRRSFHRRSNCGVERRLKYRAPDRTAPLARYNAMRGGSAVANNPFRFLEDRSACQRGEICYPTTPVGVSRSSKLIFVVELPPAAVKLHGMSERLLIVE